MPSCEGDVVRYSKDKIEGSDLRCEVLNTDTVNGVTTLKAHCPEVGEDNSSLNQNPTANATVVLEPHGDRMTETWDEGKPQTSARCPDDTPISPDQ